MDRQQKITNSKAFEDLLLKEQVKVLYEGLGSSVAGSILIGFVIYLSNPAAMGANDSVTKGLIIVWIVAILRGADALIYSRSKEHSKPARWYLVRFFIGAIFGAFSWGVFFWTAFPGSAPEFQVFLVLVVTGIASFAATTLSYHLGVITVFLVIVILPIEIKLLLENSAFFSSLSLLIPLYFIFQIAGAKRINKKYRENISLHIEYMLKEKEYKNLQYAVDQHNIVSITDADGKLIYANKALEDISQYTHEELLGSSHRLNNSGHHPKSFWEDMWGSVSKGKVWHGEVKNKTKDGRSYWVDSTIVPFVDKNGIPSEYISIRTDITKLKELEEKILTDRNDALIRAQVSQILQGQGSLKHRMSESLEVISGSEGFKIQNKLGVFLLPEGACELEMFVTHGTYTDEFLHREKCVKLGSCLCGRAAVSGELLVSDDCMTDPDHEHQFEGMRSHGHYIVPLLHLGKVFGILFIYTDPYPSRDRSRLDTLKYIGDLFALAIANEQVKKELEQARHTAESMAQAKSDFLANMSHEIRTPMNGVLGMLDLLSNRALDKQSEGYVEIAHGSASMLLNVINDILDISKIESGKLHIENINFDLRKTVEDSAHLLSKLAHQKGLELSCYIPPDTVNRVSGDMMRLQQVLNNLTSNAIKFTRQGEVKVTVHLLNSRTRTSRIRFEITDTGIGIPLKKQDLLFQAFTQADTSTSREFGGTGLGLAISKKLVEMMGGEIGVISEEGVGTTFWFELPFTEVNTSSADTKSLEQLKILTIDDNETNCLILQKYVESWGALNITTTDPQTGLARLRKAVESDNPFDILLLDMQMPGVSGQDIAETIRNDTLLKNIKIILLSSMSIDLDTDKSKLFNLMLNKPIRQSLLYDAIATVENRQSDARTARSNTPDSAKKLTGKILFVDDNLVNQQVGKEMLRQLGLAFEVVSNGQEALNARITRDFDLVLMDCQMPVMDGFEATRSIRQFELKNTVKNVPIVALTANAMEGDREKCIDVGMNDYLSKPYSSHTLYKTLSSWLPQATVGTKAVPDKQKIDTREKKNTDDLSPTNLVNYKVSQIPVQVVPRPETAPATDLIDLLKFEETRGVMGDSMAIIIDAFTESGKKNIDDMSRHFRSQDIEALRDSAHALKGSCGALGIQRLFERSREAEENCRKGDLSDMEIQIQLISQDFNESLDAVQKLLTEEAVIA